jgi:rubrerythrin
MVQTVREVLAHEDSAVEQRLSGLAKDSHPAVKALLESVDVDEMKHLKMLKSLLHGIERK